MRAREFMTPSVEAILSHLPVREAARQMKQHNVGILMVCDTDRLVGIVTDRDITVRVVARGLDPDLTRVADVMTTKPVFCYADDDMREVSHLMARHKIRRIPVMSRTEGLVGLLSLGDMVRAGEGARYVAEVLESAAARRL